MGQKGKSRLESAMFIRVLEKKRFFITIGTLLLILGLLFSFILFSCFKHTNLLNSKQEL